MLDDAKPLVKVPLPIVSGLVRDYLSSSSASHCILIKSGPFERFPTNDGQRGYGVSSRQSTSRFKISQEGAINMSLAITFASAMGVVSTDLQTPLYKYPSLLVRPMTIFPTLLITVVFHSPNFKL